MRLQFNGPAFWVTLVIVVLLLWFVGRWLLRFPAGALFGILAAVFTITAVYIIFRVPPMIKGDAAVVAENAGKFLRGDYAGLEKGHYLDFWPAQLGLVAWDGLLFRISDSVRILFIANIGFSLINCFLQWQIAAALFRDEPGQACAAEKLTILLSYAFLPLLFFVLFAYGFVPGLCFAQAAFLSLIRFSKAGGVVDAVLCPVFLSLALFFKPNYLITAIALGITVMLLFAETRKKAYPAILAALILVTVFQNAGLYAYYEKVSGMEIRGDVPRTLTMAMSVLPEYGETERPAGWYNGYEYDAYVSVDYDRERGAQLGREKLAETMSYWVQNPGKAIRFFGEKWLTTWCDPMYESVWIGPLVDDGAAHFDPVMESLYAGDYAYLVAEKWMTALAVLVYGGAALFWFPWNRRRFRDAAIPTVSLYTLLFLLGGVMLHLISETKSQYAFPYVYCLIPYASCSMANSRLFVKRAEKNGKAGDNS
ncbi:MAG: hypothetical protein K6G16_07170 [Lachnospiraceae bacterium]|nr:hypothetical protein [Lachnospiraceae bacterium]